MERNWFSSRKELIVVTHIVSYKPSISVSWVETHNASSFETMKMKWNKNKLLDKVLYFVCITTYPGGQRHSNSLSLFLKHVDPLAHRSRPWHTSWSQLSPEKPLGQTHWYFPFSSLHCPSLHPPQMFTWKPINNIRVSDYWCIEKIILFLRNLSLDK